MAHGWSGLYDKNTTQGMRLPMLLCKALVWILHIVTVCFLKLPTCTLTLLVPHAVLESTAATLQRSPQGLPGRQAAKG